MKFNRRCPIGGSFWPRGIYSVVNHARITTGQTSVCATEPVRAAGCPGGLLHGRAAVGQRCGGTAGHLRTSGPHLGGWAVVSGVLHWRHSGKFAVAADSAARRPAPAPADGGDIGDGGGAGCVQRCGPLDWRWRRRGFFGDHGGRWCRHRSLQRRLHRHDLQHVARGTAGRATAPQGAAGSVLATGVTLVIVPMLAHGNEMARYHDLLWLGAAGLVCSGIAALFVGPMRSVSVTTATRMPLREIYWMGFAIARSQPWFRRYMTTYLLFVPISLGTTFFSLRAAQSNGSLHVLVILSSIGLVVGSMLWRPPVRGAWPAAGQRTAQRRCCAAVHGGRVVWAVGSRLGVRHGVPAGYGGRSNGGRRIDIVDQRPRARAVPRHPDLRWVDLGRRRSHRAGSCARRNCPKACHHLAGCRRADTGRNRRGGESARTDTNRGDGGHEPASSDLASLPPGHS